MSRVKTINIIIAALGGEGGGVLAEWITEVATSQGFLAQSTSVPGVAQRTGATIYYLEIFATSENTAQKPVMSLFPTQGDIDIVIASEIVEAGRMIQRGFVTPERTTLITSDHRVYAIGERIVPGNGIVDSDKVRQIAHSQAKCFIHDDMKTLAHNHGTVISATLFGALAASKALAFSRDNYEQVIRHTGKAVEANLAAFSDCYHRVSQHTQTTSTIVEMFRPSENDNEIKHFQLPAPTTTAGSQLLRRINNEFAVHSHEFVYLGVKRLLSYQDANYANQYLDLLKEISLCKQDYNGELLRETARYLALWMSYEDIVRVAEIKITPQRFQRFAKEIHVDSGQLYNMVEFLRPQVEEYVSILPVPLAKHILNSPLCQKVLNYFTKEKYVSTNKLSGFLQFYLLAKLKPLRRKSWGFHYEHQRINRWLSAIKHAQHSEYKLAVELAKSGRLIKGYGDTRKRGHLSMHHLLNTIEQEGFNSSAELAQYTNKQLNQYNDKNTTSSQTASAS